MNKKEEERRQVKTKIKEKVGQEIKRKMEGRNTHTQIQIACQIRKYTCHSCTGCYL